jgi:demethylmenaquinone methyltransferase / 2-methoxy-6-polyprenyl-1,4-benzoquinol methylase
MKGAAPEGATGEREAAVRVRDMFARVAHHYDLANHLLSFNIDRLWRAHTARRLGPLLERPGARALDICCGTGDLLLALERAGRASVLGSDFCHPMLAAAGAKIRGRGRTALLFASDALRLPLPGASLDLLTVAFGFRNLANYASGLAEFRRVLKPGGTAAILEFSQPRNAAFAVIYNFYSRWILPRIGGALSGSGEAYRYLHDSVRRFPAAPQLADDMRRQGFVNVRYEYLTGGIVALHLGQAP